MLSVEAESVIATHRTKSLAFRSAETMADLAMVGSFTDWPSRQSARTEGGGVRGHWGGGVKGHW